MANPVNVADFFELFQQSRDGNTRGMRAHAVQEKRLNEITAARAIPLAKRDPAAFAAKLAQLPPKDRAYVLAQLARGQPAAVSAQSPAGRMDQVWFPVQVAATNTPGQAAEASRLLASKASTQIQASQEKLHTLMDGRQVGPDTLQAVAGTFYRHSMVGK
jgi:hypothetical protein